MPDALVSPPPLAAFVPAGALTAGACDAAIVDLDGTMVDTLGDFDAAIAGMLSDLGLPQVGRALVHRTIGRGTEHLIDTVLAHALQAAEPDGARPAGAVADRREAARERYERHYTAVNGRHSTVYPGVAEGLALLRGRGLRLACVTNKPLAFARQLLAAKGLDGWFDQVFGGDSFPRKKPDPLPMLQACEALGSAPARTLAVGDSRNDAAAADAAGCPVVLVTYGYNHGEPIDAVAALAHVPRMDAIPAALGWPDAGA
ncbi:MAG: phosphoglycolate phosphatase [Xylophilus ampelinus]